MTSTLYIEGGGSKEAKIRCREGFSKLFAKAGMGPRMPRTVASGSRSAAFNDFATAHANRKMGDYVAMVIDSEDRVADIEKTWQHLKHQDDWDRPRDAKDDQVILMTTCMESWLVADPEALRVHYGHEFHEKALPALHDLENRSRFDLQKRLVHATRDCSNVYEKGARSFEVLPKLNPEILQKHLPSFTRALRILRANL